MLVRTEFVVFVILLVYNDIFSQPITKDGINNIRDPRQVDFETCCPCPDSANRNTDDRYPANIMKSMGKVPSSTNLDNCSHQSRSADSEGSSSILFPTAMRNNGPSSRSSNQKEEQKNLLEPEVGLASSVLETIREATEAEYQDALAREAAKTRDVDDVIANESAPNIVTIILPSQNRDNDDVLLSEATQAHESRCIQPVGSSLSKIRKPIPNNLLEKLSNVKFDGLIHKNLLDKDNIVQASNVQESFSQKLDPGLELRNKPVERIEQNSCLIDSKINSKPGQSVSLAEQTNENNKEESKNLADKLQVPPLSLKPLLLSNKDLFKVKSLLKLRDTEFLLPNKKLDIPLLKLPSIFQRRLELPDISDSLRNNSNFKNNNMWSNIRTFDNTLEDNESGMKTSILEILPTSTFNKNKEKNHKLKKIHDMSNLNTVPTKKDFIDIVSSPSENNVIVNLNTNDEKKSFGLARDVIKENEDACKNIDQTYEEVDNISYEMNENLSDLISDGTEGDQDISVTNNENNKDHISDIENEASDELSDNYCFEFIDDDREKNGSSAEVFDNNDNLDSETTSVVTNESLNSGNDKKATSLESVNLKGMKKLVNQSISFPLSKSLTSIKENIQKKIQEFKKSSTEKTLKAITDINKQSEPKKVPDKECQNVTSLPELELSKQNIPVEDVKKILDNVSIEDLQKMSDSLLKINEVKEKPVNYGNTSSKSSENSNLQSVENLSTETDSKELLNSRSQPPTITKNLQNLKVEKINKGILQNKLSNDQETKPHIISGQSEYDCLIQDSSFQNTDKENNQLSHLGKGVDPNEMTAEASDPIINAIHQDPFNFLSKLKSPLLQDIIVQPSSLTRDDLNPFSDRSGLDLSDMLKIPTLDDINERLKNLFDTNERESEPEGIDCESDSPIMSSEPSDTIFQSRSPLKPLEDVDIDIFQVKPFQIGKSNLLSELPRLNLKSYKAKLPIPNDFQLTPMNIESTLSKNGGLLGAIFRIGPESDNKNILSSPLGKSSTIEDVTSQLRNKVESFLNSPLDTLQDFQPSTDINMFTGDLKSQTLNVIKEIQENIGNPLKIDQNSDSLSGLKKQHDVFLEKVADLTDDLNDKFKGLHHDLNDRLLSLHENILDKTKLASANNLLFDDIKAKESILNPIQRRTLSKTHLARFPKEKETVNTNEKGKLNRFKMPSSASVPIPKSVAVPYLRQTGTKTTSSDLESRNPNVKHVAQSMIREGTENQPLIRMPSQFKSSSNQPIRNKPKISLKDRKFTVMIASTTPSPLSALKSLKSSNFVFKPKKDNTQAKPEFKLSRSQSKNKQDPEFKTNTSQLLNPRTVDSEGNKDIKLKSDLKVPEGLTARKSIQSLLKQRYTSKTLPLDISDRKKAVTEAPSDVLKSGSVKLPSKKERNPWPEITDTSFLSKLRDAVKARAPSLSLAKTIKDNKNGEIISDTERAGSETTDVAVVSESLKENVSYKCKMVCTKET